MIKDFSKILVEQSKQSSGNNSPSYNNTTEATQNMATETLKSTINIPPTLIVNPATVVNVLLARDVSFESVYTLVK